MTWFFALCLVCVTLGVSTADQTIEEYMKAEKIVPEVISAAPKETLQVTYSYSGNSVNLELGKELSPIQVKDKPSVKWNADAQSFYTLYLADTTIFESKPKAGEWIQWLVGNIPGANVTKGDSLVQYVGSGPPPETGLHRYVFLVFKQSSKINFNDYVRIHDKTVENRGQFSIQNFMKQYNLETPIAGNVYKAKYDDYVKTLYSNFNVNK